MAYFNLITITDSKLRPIYANRSTKITVTTIIIILVKLVIVIKSFVFGAATFTIFVRVATVAIRIVRVKDNSG